MLGYLSCRASYVADNLNINRRNSCEYLHHGNLYTSILYLLYHILKKKGICSVEVSFKRELRLIQLEGRTTLLSVILRKRTRVKNNLRTGAF